MTQHLETMVPGSTMRMEGPKGRLAYLGKGTFELLKMKMKKTNIGCVAGGTGITPCY